MKPTPSSSTPSDPRESLAAPGPRLLTLPQAARYLGLSPWTIRELIWRGVLPRVRLSRKILLDQRDLDAAIETAKDTVDGDRLLAVRLRAPMSLPPEIRKGGTR